VTLGVTPGVTLGVTPGVTLGVTPGVTPGVTLGVTPGVTPGCDPWVGAEWQRCGEMEVPVTWCPMVSVKCSAAGRDSKAMLERRG
jgi:hypothetical protein